jgi:uncharacterized protein
MKRLVSPPDDWKCGVLIADVRKNGEPRREEFELALGGSVEYWGQEYVPTGPVSAAVTSSYASGDIVVGVGVAGNFKVACYRCLADASIAIKGDMRYIFSLRHPEKGDEKNRQPGDDGEPDGSVEVIEVEPFKAEIDLSPYVWETMILSLPERSLCRQDCEGLCPICGADKNAGDCGCEADDTDPRLAVLKNFSQ